MHPNGCFYFLCYLSLLYMFLKLYHVVGTTYWQNPTVNDYSNDVWYDEEGERPLNSYIYGISEDWVRNYFIDADDRYDDCGAFQWTEFHSITPVNSLPEDAYSLNKGTVEEALYQLQSVSPDWARPLLDPISALRRLWWRKCYLYQFLDKHWWNTPTYSFPSTGYIGTRRRASRRFFVTPW